ncbi:hypothetical protein ACLMJK_009593 [Lecanora helva]
MHLAYRILLQVLVFFQVLIGVFAASTTPQKVNLTTIATNSKKESTLECWQLDAPLVASAAAGTAGAVFAQLGGTGATSYGLIPPRFNGGLHNAPSVQYVAFLSGKAVISLPNSTQTATVPGGRNGLILAIDIKNVSTLGHITVYPSNQTTVVLQIPTANNTIPAHSVLHNGPCFDSEQNTQ